MSMVERVAKAIHEHNEFAGGLSEARDVARAAIEAMREPSEAMTTLGGREAMAWDDQAEGGANCSAAVWRAMIDAALK